MTVTTVQKADLIRDIEDVKRRIKIIEGMLQGQQISTVRIKDLAVTDAKIDSISADKITTGILNVLTSIYLGDPDGGDYTEINGDTRIAMYRSSVAQLVIGKPS